MICDQAVTPEVRAILTRMSRRTRDPGEQGRDTVRRRPEPLVLAFFGELVVDREAAPVPAAELISLLGELGIGAAATRATLSRMASRGLLEPVRSGRAVAYLLTAASERVLRDARDRIFAADPFAPEGEGWTLVTFSVPESRRDVRHRVRAQLAWAGFGLLRDGLWIAPGEVDVAEVLGELQRDGEGGEDDLELAAFRAHEVPGFSVAHSVGTAWRLEEIRSRHEEFQGRWTGPAVALAPEQALRDLTALVADWLDLLRAVPRPPVEHLATDWPAPGSVATFHRWHSALVAEARAELERRLGA